MALAQAEVRNGEPADDIMWRTLAKFNGKMVPPDGKGSIAATNGRIMALESRMFGTVGGGLSAPASATERGVKLSLHPAPE